ncbi:MAG TPA: plastocyanin/azurin family copper-binding protein [Gaiellaceae bacterium]|jgi:plastocyanin|nr:plastocyanin/azurin family copper-binding protein [Gaiellaceae bacterium]
MRLRLIALALLVASLGVAVAACGGDDEGGGGDAAEQTTTAETEAETETEEEGGEDDSGGGTTLELAADPDGKLEFDAEQLSAAAGPITIEFTNEASIPHNVSVEGQTSETISGGATTLELDLEPGEYEYICAVSGHAAAGMTGTLTVE